MRRIAAALTLTALVLAGCGGDDDEPTVTDEPTTEAPDDAASGAPAETSPPADGSDPGGACPYLSTADLDAAFGATFEELAGNEAACSFSADDGPSVQVSRVDIQIDPETYAEESTSSCEDGTVVEVDAGDAAYACIAIGPTASVIEGDVLINLGVLSTDDEQATLDAFVELLPSVTVTG